MEKTNPPQDNPPPQTRPRFPSQRRVPVASPGEHLDEQEITLMLKPLFYDRVLIPTPRPQPSKRPFHLARTS
jgi:hypothetical protein